VYGIQHAGKRYMLKAILFSDEVLFYLTEVEQVYHKLLAHYAIEARS
jgi:hypothetical protein